MPFLSLRESIHLEIDTCQYHWCQSPSSQIAAMPLTHFVTVRNLSTSPVFCFRALKWGWKYYVPLRVPSRTKWYNACEGLCTAPDCSINVSYYFNYYYEGDHIGGTEHTECESDKVSPFKESQARSNYKYGLSTFGQGCGGPELSQSNGIYMANRCLFWSTHSWKVFFPTKLIISSTPGCISNRHAYLCCQKHVLECSRQHCSNPKKENTPSIINSRKDK